MKNSYSRKKYVPGVFWIQNYMNTKSSTEKTLQIKFEKVIDKLRLKAKGVYFFENISKTIKGTYPQKSKTF